MSPEDRTMLTTVFKQFENDGNGALSGAELGNLLRSIGQVHRYRRCVTSIVNILYDLPNFS